MQSLFVKGEISNCKYHPTGHIYFTLKDPKGTINCVMFAGNRSGLTFRLSEGQQVVVGGTVDVYERDGKYQLYAKQIVLDGLGLLYEKYEALKRELEECGMFAEEYKQPIPRQIKTLGVVTAKTGAAVRDIIQIATRRNPNVQIIVYPAIVQGDLAVPSIVRGIKALEQMQVDVMIVGRGGGSIEDLWAFNEREVAQAVFDCSVPIISAVGHETDTTIIDYVSDLRAPTPSAAAELAVSDIRESIQAIKQYENQLSDLMFSMVQKRKMYLQNLERNLKRSSPDSLIREKRMRSVRTEESLQTLMEKILRERRYKLSLYIERLKGLSPLEKLNSGFSYAETMDKENIKSVSQISVGDSMRTYLKDGIVVSRIVEIEKQNTV